jgi:tetratricopeptide (TPR) repeat protein
VAREALIGSAVVVWVFFVAALGCTSRGQRASAAGSEERVAASPAESLALRPVSLPDLSQVAPSAQAQIRERYVLLTEKTAKPQQNAADLANAYGELGKILMAADHRDAAEPFFLDAQALASSDFRWPYFLAHLYRQNGDLAKSIASFNRALQIRPDEVDALVWLGNLELDQGRPQDAEPKFARALSIEPTSLSARFGLGRAALAQQEYGRAVEHLERVLAQDPQASGIHYPLAMAYRGLGDSAKADAHLRLRQDRPILPADPLIVELGTLLESPQNYETRGIEALNNKDWSGAAALFRKGLELAPDHAALRHRLGTALYLMGDVGGAQKQFERVVRASPDFFLAQYSLGVLLQASGRHRDAIARFSNALKSKPDYTEARLRLAYSLRRSGRVREALPEYLRVLADSADNTEARLGYAMALVQLHRFEEARTRLAEGMKRYPDQTVFAQGLARLLAAAPDDSVRDGAKALALVQELLAKEQRTPDLGETMAMALADEGRYDEAAQVQRDLISGAERRGLHDVTARLSENLALYERHQPCRTPWTDNEMP